MPKFWSEGKDWTWWFKTRVKPGEEDEPKTRGPIGAVIGGVAGSALGYFYGGITGGVYGGGSGAMFGDLIGSYFEVKEHTDVPEPKKNDAIK